MNTDQTPVIEVPTQALYELLTNVLDGNYARNIGEMRVIYNLTQKGLSSVADTDALTKLVSCYEKAFKQAKLLGQYPEMGIPEHLHQTELTITRTAAGTYRVLINGNVHPLMVGYASIYDALCSYRKPCEEKIFDAVLPVFIDEAVVKQVKLSDVAAFSRKYCSPDFSVGNLNYLVELDAFIKEGSGVDFGDANVVSTNYFDNILDEQLTPNEIEKLYLAIRPEDGEGYHRVIHSMVYLRKLRESDLIKTVEVNGNDDRK